MVITDERIYLAGDSRAERALVTRQDFRLCANRVELTNPGAMTEFRRLLGVESQKVQTAFIRRHRGGHLVVRATRVGSQAEARLIGLVFWVADEAFEVEWPDFGPVFGLTAAEARVVEQLIQGIGAEMIAADLQVSINTVRTHICHVYEKLGITCREELWRRLAPYRVN